MPNGKPGEDVITDLLAHGGHPFPADIEALIRELARRAPDRLSEVSGLAFDWAAGKYLGAARARLQRMLDECAAEPGEGES